MLVSPRITMNIKAFEKAKSAVFDLTDLTARQTELRNEMEVVSQIMQQCIGENATVALDQVDYNQRFEALSGRFETAKNAYDEVTETISDKQSRMAQIENFLKLLKSQDSELTTFSESLWLGLLEYATVYADGRITFTFKNGAIIDE